MLIGILGIIYIFFVLATYGYGANTLLLKNKPSESSSKIPLILFLGLLVVTTLASFASLFIRINWEFQLFLLTGAVLITIFIIKKPINFKNNFFKKFTLFQKIGAIFLMVCLILSLIQAVQEPTNSDTGIYHAQSIHWIESYPVVPGLANLHERLGYNSSWLMLNAVFSFSFLRIQSFHLLSSFLFLAMILSFYQGIHHLLAKKFLLSNFVRMGFFLAAFFFLFDQVSSPGTDMPATLFLWFILAESIELLENKTILLDSKEPVYLSLLCIFALTIKLSTVPILLLPLFWIIYKLIKKNFKQIGQFVLLSFVIMVPYVARNIIQTGYPVFPGFPINIFHFDWALPVDRVKEEGEVIHWFAMLSSVPLEDFLTRSLKDQTINWFANLIPRYKAILLTIPAGVLFNLSLCVFKKWRVFVRENVGFLLVVLVFIIGDLFWFFSAPSIRFGFGFLLGSVFLILFPVVLFLVNQLNYFQGITVWFILISFIGLAIINFRTVIHYKDFSSIMLYPKEYPAWPSAPCEFHNFKLLCQAYYDSCWYSPFPCATNGNLDVEMRGSDYSDGFRQVP
ncbi:MAG: hypothetical protein NTZ74_15615 [Chloroflexi bacterium]|nr:hypothetical protein [Chloroflexota bacterium]